MFEKSTVVGVVSLAVLATFIGFNSAQGDETNANDATLERSENNPGNETAPNQVVSPGQSVDGMRRFKLQRRQATSFDRRPSKKRQKIVGDVLGLIGNAAQLGSIATREKNPEERREIVEENREHAVEEKREIDEDKREHAENKREEKLELAEEAEEDREGPWWGRV